MPLDEADRMRVLRSYAVLDTPADPTLDRITALARLTFDTPMASLALVDDHRQWSKSQLGLSACDTPREHAFCTRTLSLGRGGVLTVQDAATDPRFAGNPLVTGAPHIRFYAGAVLTSPEGANLGALCVLDTRPRPPLTALEGQTLRALADLAMSELEVQRTRRADESKQRQLQLAESMSGVGHWRLDLATSAATWSDEVYRIHGLRRDEFDPRIGDRLQFYHEDDRDVIVRHVAAAVRDRSGFSFQLRLRRSDGAWREVLCKAACEMGPGDEPAALVGVFQDVTEQQALLRQVSEERERYRLLAENANDMISLTSVADSSVQFVSPGSRRVLGYEPEELVGRKTLELTHPDDHAHVVEHFTGLLKAGPTEAVSPYQFRGRHKTGAWVWLEGQPRVQWDGAGRAVCFQDVVRDVTRRKEMEAHLEKLRDAAEAGSRAKTDFLANMSHELRTPLTGILGYADVLAGACDLGPESRTHLERIRRSGETLLSLVNDVMDLSKIEAGGLALEPRPVDLTQLLQGAVDGVWPLAAAKALRLHADLPAHPVDVVLDPDRLRQVVLNLLSNAVKFTDEGEVRLSLAVCEAGAGRTALTVAVSDTGIGVSEDQLARIFGRFEQADASITRRFGGTGLGLAISRAIVDAMGGRLAGRGAPGGGSTFILALEAPCAPPVPALPAPAPVDAPSPLAGLRVLLAEDVALNRDLIALLLGRCEVRLTSVENGAEAVETAGREPFDAVLMDMQMPVLDGVEAARRIRASRGPNARTPIIALTANVLPSEVALCRAAGMDGHLAKPFTAGSLAAALTQAVRPAPAPHPRLQAALAG